MRNIFISTLAGAGLAMVLYSAFTFPSPGIPEVTTLVSAGLFAFVFFLLLERESNE